MSRGRAVACNQDRLALDAPAEANLIGFLEPDQLVSDTSQPVPPADLTAPVRAALWALRIFTLLLAAAVVFTFVSQLTQ
jgi:hypothetical protein